MGGYVLTKLNYDHFRVLVSDPQTFGGKCPLCGTPLKANVSHECSNGKPIADTGLAYGVAIKPTPPKLPPEAK